MYDNDLGVFRNLHLGKTGLIVGCGPSLNDTPLEELSKDKITFGGNGIYRLPYEPKYYCIIDRRGLQNWLPLPQWFSSIPFVRAEAQGIPTNNPIYPIPVFGFSLDISQFVCMGGTVVYALLQIAFFMGLQTVLLVGVDHNYPVQGDKLTEFDGDDSLNHFKPKDGKPYRKPGKSCLNPQLEDTVKCYEVAKEVYWKAGRQIINLTPGSYLDVFRKEKFSNWM